MNGPPGKPYFDADGDESVQVMRTGSRYLYSLEASNIDAADAFIQLFDAVAADVTVGTTVPTLSFLVPAGDATLRGKMQESWTNGVEFLKGITYACTTTATGSTAGSTGLVINGVTS